MLTDKDRDAVPADLSGYRRIAASCKRTAAALAKHAEGFAAKMLAADLALDLDEARYHERIAGRLRREAEAAWERRAVYIATIRELERDLG